MRIKELKKENINQKVTITGLLQECKVKTAKSDKKYCDLSFKDQEKNLDGKFWDYEKDPKMIESINTGKLVEVEGTINEWNDKLQISVRVIKEIEGDVSDYIPSSTWPDEVLNKGIGHFIKKVESKAVKRLIEEVIFDEKISDDFKTYPAAKEVHHNFHQGLLQHTLEVLKIGYTLASTKRLNQKQIDRFIAIGFLHDIGKLMEYKPLPETERTDEGIMLGHIFLGSHKIQNTINSIEKENRISKEDELVILNGVLSHHGLLEFGSPVTPKTIEAQILHQADKMSGDIESIQSFINTDESEGSFTSKLWNTATEYYKK